MKSVPVKSLIKIGLFIIILGVLILSGWDIYRQLKKASEVSQEIIQSYYPSLNLARIKKAAELLEK